MHPLLTAYKPLFQAAIEHFRKELASLRTGRATPALVEDVKVPAYDTYMELKGVATIHVLDAKTLIIEPWDAALLRAIEKAIRDADVGLNPAIDGKVVRIVLPMMTEENRKNLVRNMKERLEEAKVKVRGVREEAREQIVLKEKAKEMSEDEKFRTFDELEKLTKECTQEIDQMGEKKEAEIMTI